jgi:hypothetical protein
VNLPIGLTLTRIVAVPAADRVPHLVVPRARAHRRGDLHLAAITDWADGMLARRRNQVTTLGTLLDPIADKLLVAAALVSLLAIDKIDAWIVVVIIGRELAVTGLRAVAASVGVIVPALAAGEVEDGEPVRRDHDADPREGIRPSGFHYAADGDVVGRARSHTRLGRRLLLSLLPEGRLPRDRAGEERWS